MSKKAKKQLPIEKDEYDRLVDQCLEIIKNPKNPILFISDLATFLPFSRSQFYRYGLDKCDKLKEAITDNKIIMKQALRGKWYSSENPTLSIALYKLIANDEEREILRNNPKQEIINIPTTEKIKSPLSQLFFKSEKGDNINLDKL